MFSDNFIIQNSNPYSAISQCKELVDDESKITIDVLLLGEMKEFETTEHTSSGWFGGSDSHEKSFSNFMRGRDIKYQYSNSNSIN